MSQHSANLEPLSNDTDQLGSLAELARYSASRIEAHKEGILNSALAKAGVAVRDGAAIYRDSAGKIERLNLPPAPVIIHAGDLDGFVTFFLQHGSEDYPGEVQIDIAGGVITGILHASADRLDRIILRLQRSKVSAYLHMLTTKILTNPEIQPAPQLQFVRTLEVWGAEHADQAFVTWCRNAKMRNTSDTGNFRGSGARSMGADVEAKISNTENVPAETVFKLVPLFTNVNGLPTWDIRCNVYVDVEHQPAFLMWVSESDWLAAHDSAADWILESLNDRLTDYATVALAATPTI